MDLEQFKPPLARRLYERLHRVFKAIEKSDTGRESIIGTIIIFIVILFLCFDFKALSDHFKWNTKEPLESIDNYFTLLVHTFTIVFVVVLFLLKIMRLRADPFRAPAKQIIKNWSKILETVEKLEIADNWYVKEFDIEKLVVLAINGYGTEYISRDHRFRIFYDWHKARPDIFSFVCNEENRAIGYVLVLPLKNGDHFQDKGNVGKSMFSIMDLEIKSRGGANFVLIQGAHLIDKELKNLESASRLVFELLIKLAFFVKNDNSVIYSEVFSKGSRRLLEHMGFQDTGKKGVQGYAIYELKLKNEHDPKANVTVRAIKQLQKRISYPRLD